MQTFRDYSLLRANTFGIDQKCDEYIVYEDASDAVSIAKALGSATSPHAPLLLLGGGSNLLLTRDFHGRVVTPAKRFDVSVLQPYGSDGPALRCWAGTTFDDVVAYAVGHGYYGLENLSLIPGECGASAVQNIGAYGAEIKDVLTEIEAVEIATGRVVRIKAQDCRYAYRDSRFKHEWKDRYIILYVTYQLSRTFTPKLGYGNIRKVLAESGVAEEDLTAAGARTVRDAIIGIRRAKLPDPAVTGNAGSFFMNPVVDEPTFLALKAKFPDIKYYEAGGPAAPKSYKIPAGWMIDQCGWKGRSLGKAGVHDKQALVLVNRGGASGQEIVELMRRIQDDVGRRFGIELHPEVNII